jgi:hypothetical protein
LKKQSGSNDTGKHPPPPPPHFHSQNHKLSLAERDWTPIADITPLIAQKASSDSGQTALRLPIEFFNADHRQRSEANVDHGKS